MVFEVATNFLPTVYRYIYQQVSLWAVGRGPHAEKRAGAALIDVLEVYRLLDAYCQRVDADHPAREAVESRRPGLGAKHQKIKIKYTAEAE